MSLVERFKRPPPSRSLAWFVVIVLLGMTAGFLLGFVNNNGKANRWFELAVAILAAISAAMWTTKLVATRKR